VWVARPDKWFLRGADLAPSTYGEDSITLTPLLMALFVPTPAVNYILNFPLRAPSKEAWPRAQFASESDLIMTARDRILPWLDSYPTPRAVAQRVTSDPTTDPYALEVAHAAMLLDGDVAEAESIIRRMTGGLGAHPPPWAPQIVARAHALQDVARESLPAAVRVMADRRVELLEQLRLAAVAKTT
jgi:hypothetical protein